MPSIPGEPGKDWKTEVLLSGSWRNATSLLLTNGSYRLVIDTGMPHEEHLLVNALRQHGLSTSDIDAIINTHFHIDHVLNNSLFVRSAIYATQESHDWCCSLYSDLLDTQRWEKLILKYYPQTLEYDHAVEHLHQMRKFTLRWWDRKRLGHSSQHHWLESHSLPEGLNLYLTSGHVPGHVSVIVPEQEQTTVVAGDACLSRYEDVRVLTMIPRDREQARLDRRQVLALGTRIFPGHDVEFTINGNGGSEGLQPNPSQGQ
ncbi:MAG TPA: MBL fold metallo-hydrolase [Terriglobia bacterium]|nr:MBL fold metallo-hydrolase [Terriglobia bacterium]